MREEPHRDFVRKILYAEKQPNSRVPAMISIPRWWVKDTRYVKMRVYADRIIITRARGDAE